MIEPVYFSRDISWLSFNQRLLMEASRSSVPLAGRFRFLSIFSSNLDEWYRVRMPVVMAKQDVADGSHHQVAAFSVSASEFDEARRIINRQQQEFGQIITKQLTPALAMQDIVLLYNQTLPSALRGVISDYFFSSLAAFLQPLYITPSARFFPENNKLYLLVSLRENNEESQVVINIPSDFLSRFFSVSYGGSQYIFFIDDIIKQQLFFLFPGKEISGCYSFKINRDADLNLEDELPGGIAEKIEKQIAKRDTGLASRLLYQSDMPLRHLQLLCNICETILSNAMQGGKYHNLKDFADLPVTDKRLFYPMQTPLSALLLPPHVSLFSAIDDKDVIIHPPYDNYATVLRFFNEAATDAGVEEIYVTLYRIAGDSKIANALISAAKNGKQVHVFVELKARFDEANNIKWAKKMTEAGVQVIYSIPLLKVHAKIALIKKKSNRQKQSYGLLATGNLNESTARFYTDHVLLTANADLLRETELLFLFLRQRKKPGTDNYIPFKHLLVAQFNLQQTFLELIENEISNAKKGLPARIIIKVNNLEERILINKLYEASEAGVQIQLIVRSICCLVPGVTDMSQNITIRRIVGRYLEHGRVFMFHNNGKTKVFMGSADWMNRNMYTRIEVCFPVYDEEIKQQMTDILNIQLSDNVQAVTIDKNLNNVPVEQTPGEPSVDSQAAIYEMLKTINTFKHA